ncbi:MAG: Gfo/Idh/MocA family oxidoreductase, partial [Candidatus Hydrogenedentes bacterium]|nr:Gfo/Idh/MocA family oxidoreductase [Candidatus Hydrogenedentota bacterium]
TDTPAWTLSSDRKIRMGVVGGRFGCSFHWHQHPNCEVAAVSDLIPERRDRLMQTYQCDKTYESLEKLILDPDIDAVAVFTGAPDHPRHTVACMEAGKHVISACPAC